MKNVWRELNCLIKNISRIFCVVNYVILGSRVVELRDFTEVSTLNHVILEPRNYYVINSGTAVSDSGIMKIGMALCLGLI